jgi:biopolymer transport protein ExbB/TolQ
MSHNFFFGPLSNTRAPQARLQDGSMAYTPSQRPNREWPWLVLAVALVLAICLPLWQFSHTSGEGVSAWTPERLSRLLLGPEQIASYCCFVWAAFILGRRYLEVRRQRRAFGMGLLPTEVGVCILPEDARLLQRKVEQQASVGGPYILANMIRLALGKYAVSRSGRDVAETVRTQADVDLGRLVSSMATVHYLAWAIPAIGFLGTVRGLATSLTMGGRTDLEIAAFIQKATEHLDVAFDCTLVALALSLVLMFLLHSVQREEEALVLDCQQYCLEHLVARLYDQETEHAAEPARLP